MSLDSLLVVSASESAGRSVEGSQKRLSADKNVATSLHLKMEIDGWNCQHKDCTLIVECMEFPLATMHNKCVVRMTASPSA